MIACQIYESVYPNYEEPATTTNLVAELSRIVAGRRRFSAQRETERNLTVQFSSVFRCALGLMKAFERLNYVA